MLYDFIYTNVENRQIHRDSRLMSDKDWDGSVRVVIQRKIGSDCFRFLFRVIKIDCSDCFTTLKYTINHLIVHLMGELFGMGICKPH